MTYRTPLRFAALAAVSQLAIFAAPAAFAQTPETDAASGPRDDVIIVTARKTEESLQDVPLSIAAYSAEALEELGAKDISELSDFTPGFTMEKFGGRRGAEGDTSRPVIRGQANVLGETNAAVFVDGIPYSESFLSFPFAAVERIEVVKGPQAALFGRSTFAGAINVITKTGTNDFEHNITATAATHSEYEVNASSSGPLVEDKVFYFINGRIYDYGGEYKNSIDGASVGQESSWGLNGALEFRPNENLAMTFRAGYNKDDDNIPAQVVQSRFFNNCFLDQARQYYCGEVMEFDEVTLNTRELGDEAGLEREVSRITGTVEWDIGGSGYVVTSNTGYTKSDSIFGNDQTYLGDTINFAGASFTRVEESDQSEWSSELRLDTPSQNALRGSVGYFYYNREKESFRRRPAMHDTLPNVLIADFGNQYTDNWAVFGAVEYDLTPQMTARGEVRYQEDTIGNETAAGPVLERTFSSTTPRFTLDYRVSDDVLLYGSIAKGNKPGAINADPALPANLQFADEEEAWNYEVGAKTTLLDGMVQANVALYQIDWTSQQLTNSVFVSGVPTSLITNAGESEVQGFEVDTIWRPTPDLTFGLGYAYADAQLTEYCDPVQGGELTGFDCLNADGIDGGQTAGNQIPNAPKHHFTASSEYIQPIANTNLDWFIRGNYSYVSKKYAQVHNLAHTGDRSLLNLKFGLQSDSWTATLFVNNVLDDKAPATVVRFADLVNLNVGPGNNNVPGTTSVERGFLFPLAESRQYGLTVSHNF